jgi:hypothetical protein
MIDAQHNERHDLELEKEIELIRLFDSKEDYEEAMKLYEEYERDEREYLEYVEQMEEESVNFERLQK